MTHLSLINKHILVKKKMNLLEMQPVERQVMCFTDSPHIYDIISLKQWTHLSLINKHILDKKKDKSTRNSA